MPETVVFKSHHLAHGGKLGQRFGFPARLIATDEWQDFGGQDEKTAVDYTAITPGFSVNPVT